MTMKAAISSPKIQQDTDVIIRVRAESKCLADFMGQEKAYGDYYPITGAHETVGEVYALGTAVSGISKGDRVGTLVFHDNCGKCADYLDDFEIHCEKTAVMGGITSDGERAAYLRCDAGSCVKIPDSLPVSQKTPFMGFRAAAYEALKTCALKRGDVVGIIGVSGLGHVAIQMSKCMGLQVVAFDKRPGPLRWVQQQAHAPDLTINMATTDAADAIGQVFALEKNTAWPGLDACIICTNFPDALKYSAKVVHEKGMVVLLKKPGHPVPVTPCGLTARDVKVVGSLLSNVHDAQEMINLVAENNIKDKVNTNTNGPRQWYRRIRKWFASMA